MTTAIITIKTYDGKTISRVGTSEHLRVSEITRDLADIVAPRPLIAYVTDTKSGTTIRCGEGRTWHVCPTEWAA